MDVGYLWWKLRRKLPITTRHRRRTNELLKAHGFHPRADGSWVKPAPDAKVQERPGEG